MTDTNDDLDVGHDLEIKKVTRRASGGGTWVCGTLSGHRFDALVFPEHADCPVLTAVQQRTEMSQAALDALMALVEEIVDHFRTRPLDGFPEARCVEVVNEPVYALEHLDELRQFTSIITLTLRVWR